MYVLLDKGKPVIGGEAYDRSAYELQIQSSSIKA
jgi:hypothetical protein